MKPKISIIVPVYNVEKYLCSCLDSIISQTFTEWECILVDDGSTDQSGAICDEYAALDNRFIVVHKHNEGVVKARITAFEHSRGAYVTFIDSDDYVSDDYLCHLYKCICTYNVDMACCQYISVVGGCEKVDIRPELGYFDKDAIIKMLSTDFLYNQEIGSSGMPLFLWLKLIRKEYVGDILNVGQGLWYGEDMVSILMLVQRIESMYISDQALYYYISRIGQATKRMDIGRWDANIKLWERLIELDEGRLLGKQLTFRIKAHIVSFMINTYRSTNSFKDFANVWNRISHNQIVHDYFISVRFSIANVVDKLLVWSLQHERLLLFYGILKIRDLYKTIF